MRRHTDPADPVQRIRRFNRLYTHRLRLLDRSYLESSLTLSEVRVLYEIVHRDSPAAHEIGSALQLDAGYLSRLLLRLRRQGLIKAAADPADRRRRSLVTTPLGARVFRELDRRAAEQVQKLLGSLAANDRARLVDAMGEIEDLLAGSSAKQVRTARVWLRALRPGDLGWVVQRHGELYAREQKWGVEFERFAARIAGEFASRDNVGERAWIATVSGRRAGCIFLTRESARVARLRMLLVEPWARGRGVGKRLVDACLTEARRLGYARIELFTTSNLDAARHVYQSAGFSRTHSAPHPEFGRGVISETWEREL